MAILNTLEQLPRVLLPWYRENRRDLPWRRDREPYHVWISEIMLQQTRVEAVKGYYARFLNALPTVADLAKCDDDALHKLWEGLGYYSRVRNLKKAAGILTGEYGGRFPETYSEVLALPGIGEYTAGAICSICFDQPSPAVDGNVLRVMTRLTENDTPINDPKLKATVRRQLAEVYPEEAGDFTQALMELGATVCGPNRRPDCENCPCREFCRARLHGTAEKFPVKGEKKGRRAENMTVFILSCDGCYGLQKRPDTGLLASLWQFPNTPGHLEPQQALAFLEELGLRPKELLRQTERSHIFTHIQWQMRGLYVTVAEKAGELVWMTADEIEKNAALPTAFRQFWEEVSYV